MRGKDRGDDHMSLMIIIMIIYLFTVGREVNIHK